MLVILYLLSLMLNVPAIAVPTHHALNVNTDLTAVPSNNVRLLHSLYLLTSLTPKQPLSSRQIITAGASVSCCEICAAAYDYSTFWQAFDNLCTWAGKGLELWSTQTYFTGNYYCPANSEVCMHMEIQFLCFKENGNGYAMQVDYEGCIVG